MSFFSFDPAALADCACDECQGVGRFADGVGASALEFVSSKETGDSRLRAAGY